LDFDNLADNTRYGPSERVVENESGPERGEKWKKNVGGDDQLFHGGNKNEGRPTKPLKSHSRGKGGGWGGGWVWMWETRQTKTLVCRRKIIQNIQGQTIRGAKKRGGIRANSRKIGGRARGAFQATCGENVSPISGERDGLLKTAKLGRLFKEYLEENKTLLLYVGGGGCPALNKKTTKENSQERNNRERR